MISKKEVHIVRTVLAGMLSKADFCSFIASICYLYSDRISQKSGCCLVGTCGQLKLADTNF
jgi:hypothetical protein